MQGGFWQIDERAANKEVAAQCKLLTFLMGIFTVSMSNQEKTSAKGADECTVQLNSSGSNN